jgi:hypothetical protein
MYQRLIVAPAQEEANEMFVAQQIFKSYRRRMYQVTLV